MARLASGIFPALSESVVSKLHSYDIFTVYDFMLQKCDELMKKTGLTFKEIEEIRESFYAKFGGEAENLSKHYKQEQNSKIPTGIQKNKYIICISLDALLGGGLRCGAIYEICGSSSAGKSQLCHWLSMYATSNDSATVHYIDGSRNFCANRILMMLEARRCDNGMIGHVMSSIQVYQISKIYELFNVFHSLADESDKDPNESSKKRLIIIDSLAVLCAIVSDMAILNRLLCNVSTTCRYIVDHSETVIVIVNTVISDHGAVFLSQGQDTDENLKPTIRASLGNYWLYVPDIRLLITQEEKNQRKIAIWKSNQLENGNSCLVKTKDEGFVDNW